MPRKNRRTQRLSVVNPDCAGIDIGKDRHFVAVDPARSSEPVRAFDAFTRDLEAMAAWLSSCGVKKVAMESTSVYWIPVYEVLDRCGFEVMLVPPRMTKQIAGRKSDVLDCQWIWQLLSYGLLRGAFRPGDAICPLRSYVRQMKRLTEDRSRCVQHMQKALTQMNVRLDSVLADIMGVTGQKILRAIIDGERDPQCLASFRHRRVKASADTIAASLEGTWREEHLFALEQAMLRYDFFEQQIEDCEARIAAQIDDLTPPDGSADDATSRRNATPGSDRRGLEIRFAPQRRQQACRARQGLDHGPAQYDGRRPYRDPDHRHRYRPDDRFRDRPGLLRLPVRPALLLLAGGGAGNQDQRRQAFAGPGAQGGQPGRAGPAHGSHDSAKEPDLHRRQTPRPPRPKGRARRDYRDRPRACLPDLPDGDAGRGLCREGHRHLREEAHRPDIHQPETKGPTTRLSAGPNHRER